MTKKVLLFLLCFSFLITGFLTAMDMKPKSIEAVMNEIRQEQGLKKGEAVKANKVSPMKLEELGDAVMEAMIGNSELHEQMDKKMGGEGSASLATMHRRIGYNYLAGFPFGMMGMKIGFPFFGTNWNFGGHMTGGYGFGSGMMGSFGWGGMLIGLIFLIIIALVVVLLVRAAMGGHVTGPSSSESPLDILKKRYAKGEISKDDFEKMKKDLLG